MATQPVYWPLLGALSTLVLMTVASIRYTWIRSGPSGQSEESHLRHRKLKILSYGLLVAFGLWGSFEMGREESARAERAARRREFLATPAGKIWERHSDWSWEVCRMVADGRVHVGMTGAQVEASLGEPGQVSHRSGPEGIATEWAYQNGPLVRLEKGVVTLVAERRLAAR